MIVLNHFQKEKKEEEDTGITEDEDAEENAEEEEEEDVEEVEEELQRIMDQEVVEFSNLLANLYQVTNMSRRLYFCLCYTKPRYSLSNI